MPSLKDLRSRIASVKSTQKITKAMQMVAAAKLRRAEESAKAARPYTERMEGVLANLAASVEGNPSAPKLLTGTGKDETHLLIFATAERGLCGGFNSSIVRLAREHIVKLQSAGKTVKIVTVGKKGREQLKRLYSNLFIDHVDLSSVKKVGYANAYEISETVLGLFADEKFDIATVFFARFQSVISQEPTAQQIIPVKEPALRDAPSPHSEGERSERREGRGNGAPQGEGQGGADLKGAVYEYEYDEADILNALLPRYIGVQVFKALLENAASEQGARMSAMDNATRNAGEMIDKLTLQYNRARQAQITKELIEIISGAEAL